MPPLASWRVAFGVPRAYAAVFSDLLVELIGSASSFDLDTVETAIVEGFVADRPDEADLIHRIHVLARALDLAPPRLEVERVPATDWIAHTHAAFPPMRLGRWWVHGSHVTDRPPPGAIPIRIDAATAFGSGDHPTTEGCLAALEGLAKRARRGGWWPRRILDMGCGTAILSIAAAKRLPVDPARPILAVDIDRESVRVARINAAANRVAARVRAHHANGYRSARVRSGGPYDLVLANILARPLVRMAPDVARHLAPGGHVVVSGLLDWQRRVVVAAYRAQGLPLVRRVSLRGWSVLIHRKSPARRPR